MEKQNNNGFIPLESINFRTARTQFKFKRGVKSFIGVALVGVGIITLPLPTGSPLLIGLGLMLVNPISFKYSLRNTKEDLIFKINKRLVLWGLK
jgi:hypothetical protein